MDLPPIRITVGDIHTTAVLSDHPAARDLLTMLPLHLERQDLFEREKYGHLQRPLQDAGSLRAFSYEVGQLVYWSPGPDIAIFYRHDGKPIPKPGIIVLGTVASIDVLRVHGPLQVVIDLAP